MRKKLPRSINLVETVHAPGDAFTIFYEWTFTIGKYLLILVQIIVIVVFIIRLSVDRINNDLTASINNQVEFLMQEDFQKNESKFRDMQLLFQDFTDLDEGHVKNARKIIAILDSIPNNVTLLDFSFSANRIGANFTSDSLENVKNYEAFLKQNPEFSDVRLNLEKRDEDKGGIEFSVNYIIVSGK